MPRFLGGKCEHCKMQGILRAKINMTRIAWMQLTCPNPFYKNCHEGAYAISRLCGVKREILTLSLHCGPNKNYPVTFFAPRGRGMPPLVPNAAPLLKQIKVRVGNFHWNHSKGEKLPLQPLWYRCCSAVAAICLTKKIQVHCTHAFNMSNLA